MSDASSAPTLEPKCCCRSGGLRRRQWTALSFMVDRFPGNYLPIVGLRGDAYLLGHDKRHPISTCLFRPARTETLPSVMLGILRLLSLFRTRAPRAATYLPRRRLPMGFGKRRFMFVIFGWIHTSPCATASAGITPWPHSYKISYTSLAV
ncbi:hypothetical protein DPMN_190009 [Dreissena polymorpha]|uniref:Uncharacterized protein n=1 Tax=Dreissena polymorpha TaxID=45954 RepID=A0A9D4ICX0_DREPO|nr:hypothetical protein DPMN_190009 [Dreissena polymorpha]